MKPFDLTIKWANRGPIIWWWKVMLMKIIWLLIGVKCLHWVVEKQGCMASGLSVRFKSKQQESKLLWVYINHHLRAIKFRAEFTFDQNKNCLDVRTFGSELADISFWISSSYLMIMAEYYNKRQQKTAEAPSKHNLNIVNVSGRQKMIIGMTLQWLLQRNISHWKPKHSLTLNNRKIQIGGW